MGALSWVRLSRRVPGLVRQRELVNVESLIDAEAGRQPTRNLFILSCAIPAGIGFFGALSVFVSWIEGSPGVQLALGSALTVILAACAWYTFFRLYRSIPPSKRRLRDLILKFSEQYSSFGNIILGEQPLSDAYATLLDEAAGIYLRHSLAEDQLLTGAPIKALRAIEDALSKLLEVALVKENTAQSEALIWAQPLLQEMRLLDQSLAEHAMTSKRNELADPLARLGEARFELESSTQAIQEIDQHLRAN